MRTPWRSLFALVLAFAGTSGAGLPITLSMDEVVGVRGQTVTMPVRITSEPLVAADSIVSGQFDLVFDPTVLVPDTMLSRQASGGTIMSKSMVATNVEPGLLRLAFASADAQPYVGDSVVVRIVFHVIGQHGQESSLEIHNILFNELPGGATEPGMGWVLVRSAPPVFTSFPSAVTVMVGQAMQVQVKAVDDDGAVFYSSQFTQGTQLFSINGETGVMAYTPVPADVGSYTIRVTAWDVFEISTSREFRLTVLADTTKPVIIGSPSATGITENAATIVWNTDKLSTSMVRYGLTGGAMTETGNTTLTRQHAVPLTSLLSNRGYSYEVWSVDVFGNSSAVKTGTFTTLQAPQTEPLVITLRPSVERGTNQAAVSWETNRQSTTVVRYGTSSAALTDSVVGVSGSTHTATIKGLTPNTKYFFRVRSVDAWNLSVLSAIDSFTTKALLLAPVITTPPSVIARDHTSFTVRWVTDRASTSVIDVGTTAAYGRRISDTTAVTVHIVAVTNLAPSTQYNYRAGSAGPEGLGPTFSANQQVYTTDAPDTKPPVITQGPVDQGVDNESATIYWLTDEAANAIVDYSVVQPDGSADFGQRAVRMVYEKSHSVVLTNLLPSTTYRYRVSSFDLIGNGPTQAIAEFRTAAAPDLTPPVLLGRVQVSGITERSAMVRWTTDEASDSRVLYTAQSAVPEAVTVSALVTDHVVSLTGLAPSTNYTLSVYSTDIAGNPLGPIAASFRTKAVPDTIPPVITALPKVDGQTLTSFNLVNVVMSLGTNEVATAQAVFGFNQAALVGMVPASAPGLTQVLQFTNLPPDTTVFYRITVTDAAETPNSRVDIVRSFRTIKGADLTAPAITVGPVVTDVQERSFTVAWTTDEASTSRLRFGTVATNLVGNAQDPTPVQSHRITATNLTPGTKYFWRVLSADPSGNTVASSVREVTTPVERDITPPVFVRRPVATYAAFDNAVITWATDENTTAYIYYAGSTDTVFNVAVDENYRTDHIVSITNLQGGVAYVYYVEAMDNAGNSAVAGDTSAPVFQNNGKITRLGDGTAKITQAPRGGTFTTTVTPDVTYPVITGDPNVVETNSTSTTVTWTTDETSNSVVRILETSGGAGKAARAADITADLLERGRVIAQSDNVKNHQLTITSLNPGASYVLHVTSTDPSGNGETISQPVYVTLPQAADLTPPSIVEGSVTATMTQTQAIISWQTDELSDSRVDYAQGSVTELTLSRVVPDPVKNHQVVLTNLLPDQLYSYRVFSTDIRGNGPASSGIHTFTFRTAAQPDVTPPVISGVTVTGVTDVNANITWQTDEDADAFVEYGTTPSFGLTRNEPVLTKTHSLTLTNLAPSTKYYFRLAGSDRAGNTSALTPLDSLVTAATPDLTPPDAPAVVDTIPASARVVLRWAKSASPDVASYIVYRNGSILASGVGDTAYVDRSVANGITYTYEIAARDFAGNVGTKSLAVRETPQATEAPQAPEPKSPILGKLQQAETVVFEVNNAVRAVSRPTVPLTYSFVVASDSLLQNVIAAGNNIAEGSGTTSWSVSGSQFEMNKVYFWAAQASDGVAVGPITTSIRFRYGDFTSVELQSFTATGTPNGAVKVSWTLRVSNAANLRVALMKGPDVSSAREIRRYESGGLAGELMDITARLGESSRYWLQTTDAMGSVRTFGPVEATAALPASWELSSARPNPFNPTTEMMLAVPAAGEARVAVFNILGQPVATLLSGRVDAGIHRVIWNGLDTEGRSVSSGVYFVQLQTGSGVRIVRRVTLLR